MDWDGLCDHTLLDNVLYYTLMQVKAMDSDAIRCVYIPYMGLGVGIWVGILG
jgi:hypothetical protein